MMLGREGALALLEKVLALAPGDGTQARLQAGDSYLTRYTGNYIHQNVGEHDAVLTVKVRFGRREGQASTNRLDDTGLAAVVRQAADIARVQPENPELPPLPEPAPIPTVPAWDEATAACPPVERARGAREVIEIARAAGFEAAGAFSTSASELAVANSRGLRAYYSGTLAYLSAVVMSPVARTGATATGPVSPGAGFAAAGTGLAAAGAGFAVATGTAVSAIVLRQVGETATNKCADSRGAVPLDPGEYEVILEPLAVAELVGDVGYLGFSAEAYQENRSFVCGRLGQQIMDPRVTIWDDGLDGRGIPLPFDAEGVPKRKVVLVNRGVAESLVYDSRTAFREGRASTGHAVAGEWWSGPLPTNLFMAPGEASLEDMIRSTHRGILVTRFHYTNPVDPVRGILTGMTRDGTFLVEKGEIVGPVRNLRFTQDLLGCFNSVQLIGRDLVLVGSEDLGAVVVPALKLGRFNFTGVTE